jgi:hypothetical protein
MAADPRIGLSCERLRRSRLEVFSLVQQLRGEPPVHGVAAEFPRSRVMRALVHGKSRLMLGGAALAAVVTRPRLLRGLVAAAPLLRPLMPMLRPLALRYVLPLLLRSRKRSSTL